MVKSRNKMGMGRTSSSLQHVENSQKMCNIDNEQRQAETAINDLTVTVQGTEIQKTGLCAAENNFTRNRNEVSFPKKIAKTRARKCGKFKRENAFGKQNDGKSLDEVLISPIEIDGDTCIDVECGANKAVMYLAKLCVGSKGACINFSNSWFTPNDFQLLSGRETAKDWKRSIRHKGRSLKLLIAKGLIQIKPASPKTRQITLKQVKRPEKKETPDVVKELNVAAGENEQCSQPEAPNSDIPKPKRGRKLKKQKSRKKTAGIKRVFSGADVADDTVDKPNTPVQIVDKEEHDNSNTLEQSKSFNGDNRTDEETGNNRTEEERGDNRTDEEKRLDEFVKSLRLTKTTVNVLAVSSLKKDHDHWSVNHKITRDKMVRDDIEPEMPVLHKESDMYPSVNDDQWKSLVNVNALHATVTPPPTPPIQQADIAVKVVDDRLAETFKSHLASPDDGLKLRINRDKVIPNANVNENPSPRDLRPRLESVMLQDALQSARRYKEHLQQNTKNISSSNSVIQVPHIVAKFKPASQLKELDVHCSPLNQRKETAFCFPFSSPVRASSTVTSPIANNTVTTGKVKPEGSSSDFNKEIKIDHINQHNFICNDLSHFNRYINAVPNIGGGNLSEMNFKDFMAIMTSAYGPLPFSADNRDAAMAFAVMQEHHQNDNMLNFINHGQTTPLLHPMIGQQVLLAMTQQLYTMCNAPVCVPQQLRNLVPQMNKTNSDMSRTSSQKSKTAAVKRVLDCSGNLSNDLSRNKRKQIDTESDCALDLSFKKARAETRLGSIPACDGPLDFSTRTPSMPETLKSNDNNKCYTEHVGNSHLNRRPDCNKRSSASDHVTVNNYRNIYQPNTIHSQYETNRVKKRLSATCRCGRTGIVNNDITLWSVERVCHFLKSLDGCEQYTKTFRDQGISGRLLPYLTTQHLTRTLGMNVGSALTLMQAVEGKFREQRLSSTLSPCTNCRSFPQMPMPLVMSP